MEYLVDATIADLRVKCNMITRRKGQTNEQYIQVLEEHIKDLDKYNAKLFKTLFTMQDEKQLVTMEQYQTVVSRNLKLIDLLKKFNLWTGQL